MNLNQSHGIFKFSKRAACSRMGPERGIVITRAFTSSMLIDIRFCKVLAGFTDIQTAAPYEQTRNKNHHVWGK